MGTYRNEQNILNKEKIDEILTDLPEFCREYFDYKIGVENRSIESLLNYAYDLRLFFRFLCTQHPEFESTSQVTFECFNKVKPIDIQHYMSWLYSYVDENGNTKKNNSSSRARKLASLRSFMQYCYTMGNLENNPAKVVGTPTLHKKKLASLDVDETHTLLQKAENPTELSESMVSYAMRSSLRDVAIISLLVSTGIRVSELVGLDIDDIDRKNMTIKVIRKGGDEDYVTISPTALQNIDDYINYERFNEDGNIRALFLSSRRGENTRLCPRSVERIVKKFGDLVPTVKKVTPHTLRRTFGTNFYKETHDIYAVAGALHHSENSIGVTASHYITSNDDAQDKIRTFAENLISSGSGEEKPEV